MSSNSNECVVHGIPFSVKRNPNDAHYWVLLCHDVIVQDGVWRTRKALFERIKELGKRIPREKFRKTVLEMIDEKQN